MSDDTLESVLESIFDDFDNCFKVSRHPFRSFAFSTIDDKSRPAVRTMILRHWFAQDKTLILYTDKRSDKIAHLKKKSLGELMFYDRERLIQIRCLCDIKMLDYKTLENKTGLSPDIKDAKVYKTDKPPGTAVKHKKVGFNENAKEMFCALACFIKEIDWVALEDNGNKRAKFIFDSSGSMVEQTWLVP
mgnify:CR=1 FL=1